MWASTDQAFRHDSMSKELLQGTLEEWRKRGRLVDNVRDWTWLSVDDLLDSTEDMLLLADWKVKTPCNANVVFINKI